MSNNDNKKDVLDQVFSINQSDKLGGSNILNNDNQIQDNLDLENFGANSESKKFKLNLLDDPENNQVENPEENQEPNQAEEEPNKDPEEKESEEAEETPEVEVKKVDEQEKYFLQQQMEKMKSIKAQKEIETEGDLEEISQDDGAENAKVIFILLNIIFSFYFLKKIFYLAFFCLNNQSLIS